MSVSSEDEVRRLYDTTANSYDAMMDREIDAPLYDRALADLASAVDKVPGAILDSSCGSGHMLHRIATKYITDRELKGVDLSPEMVQISRDRLRGIAEIHQGDMSSLSQIQDASCAAVISFFAIHHVDLQGLAKCLEEWCRVLGSGGHLLLAGWEGSGNIDYGDASDVIARRYTQSEITKAAADAGLTVIRHSVESVDDMEMDAVHLLAKKV